MPTFVTSSVSAPSALYAVVLAALVTALVGVPLSMRLARRLGVIDEPGGRHQHSGGVPSLGGLGIALGIFAAALPNLEVDDRYGAILAGAALICVLGAVDDAWSLPPAVKLAGQTACALLPVAQGVTIDHVTLPVVLNGGFALGWWQYPVTVVFIVAVANIVNLADGIDGLAAGLCAIAGSTFAILALSLGRYSAAVLAAAIAGACLGFLRWNFHPARTFMGDSGALLLGFLLATVSIQGVMKTAAALSLVFPLVVLLVPILDTSFVILKRLKAGRPIATGDRSHLHHRMLRVGYSMRQAALLLYAWCTVLAAFAIAARFFRYRTGGEWHLWPTVGLSAFAVLALLVSVYVVYTLEILKYRHLRAFGLARSSDLPGDTPLVVGRRRRRAGVAGPAGP